MRETRHPVTLRAERVPKPARTFPASGDFRLRVVLDVAAAEAEWRQYGSILGAKKKKFAFRVRLKHPCTEDVPASFDPAALAEARPCSWGSDEAA